MVVISLFPALVLVLLAECLHWRRCRRIARLAFAAPTHATRVLLSAAAARVAAVALLLFALVSLWSSSDVITNSVGAVATDGELDRMIVIMDASKSMNIQDTGPDGHDTRATRARDLIHQLISQTHRMPRTTLLTFSESAIPVVYDAKNWDVLSTVLLRSYYTKSFGAEHTAIDHAVQKAFNMAADWIPDSTVVVLVTDGESTAALERFEMPPSIRRVLVLGVGSIEGRPAGTGLESISRLDEENLRRIANLAGGDYVNATREMLSPERIDELLPPPRKAIPPESGHTFPLMLFGVGALLLTAVPWGLAAAEKRLLHR
jgi:hypothetical protein